MRRPASVDWALVRAKAYLTSAGATVRDAQAVPAAAARLTAAEVRQRAALIRDGGRASDFDLETALMLDELARRLVADEASIAGPPFYRWVRRCGCQAQPALLTLPSMQPTPICPSCLRAYGVAS